MSEQQATENQAAPVVVPPVAPAEKPRVMADQLPPEALKARLEQAATQAQRSLLESLGLSSMDELKGLAEAKRKADDANRTEAERLAVAHVELEKMRQLVASHSSAVDAAWALESARLLPEQAAAVEAIAGADIAARLRAAAALAPTWRATATMTDAPSPAAALATTAPATAAPAPGGTTSPEDPKTVHAALIARGLYPHAAAYAKRNPSVFK